MINNYYIIWSIIWLIIWLILWYFIWKILKHTDIKKHRKDAIKKSRSVILWDIAEKIAPFIPKIDYNPKDMVFIWKWVDYIIFNWLSNWELKEIIFLEIKTWKSKQNNNEKQIEKIIKLKKIKYDLINLEIK